MDVIYKLCVSIALFLFHVHGPLETDMAVVHLLLCLFIRPLKDDINQHHYCSFPPLAQLTEPCKGQDAGMKGRAWGKPLSRQKTGGAKCLNQLSIKHTFTRLILFGNQTLWYVTEHSVYVCVCTCVCAWVTARVNLSSFLTALLTCSRSLSLSLRLGSFVSTSVRKSLNELVEAIGHRQSVRKRRGRRWWGGGGYTAGSKQPTQKELFTVQTLFPSTLLAPSISDWC